MSKSEQEVQDRSLDNSPEAEYITADSVKYDIDSDKANLAERYIASIEEDNAEPSYFKDLAGGLSYRFVPMSGDDSSQTTGSPAHVIPGGEFYVIGNTVEVFGNASSKKKAIKIDPLINKVISKKRDDKRRATHNEVERRRRDKINNWITRLGTLIPNSGLPDTASKGGILARACGFITELSGKQKRFDKLEMENEKLVMEVLKLNQEITSLRQENSTLRNMLPKSCVLVTNKSNIPKS